MIIWWNYNNRKTTKHRINRVRRRLHGTHHLSLFSVKLHVRDGRTERPSVPPSLRWRLTLSALHIGPTLSNSWKSGQYCILDTLRMRTYTFLNGNSPDKLRHTRSVAYSVVFVLLNKHQISGGGAYLHCYHASKNQLGLHKKLFIESTALYIFHISEPKTKCLLYYSSNPLN